MERKRAYAYAGALAVLVAAGAVMAGSGRARIETEPPFAALPQNAGPYTGEDLRYCQHDQCMRVFRMSELSNPGVCPACGSALDAISPGEKTLPPDTVILKREYSRPEEGRFVVSLVFSGATRNSIHRPEICLAGQGYAIENRRVVKVPVPGRGPLEMTVLDVAQNVPSATGAGYRHEAVFAYWFASRRRETPRSFDRIVWSAVDGIFGKTRPRWAYVSVQTERTGGSEEHIRRLADFTAALYPGLNPGR